MSGGSDLAFLRGFRTPCCFIGAILIVLTLGLAGLGAWVAVRFIWGAFANETPQEKSDAAYLERPLIQSVLRSEGQPPKKFRRS